MLFKNCVKFSNDKVIVKWPLGCECSMVVGLGLDLRGRDSPHEKYIRAGGGFLSRRLLAYASKSALPALEVGRRGIKCLERKAPGVICDTIISAPATMLSIRISLVQVRHNPSFTTLFQYNNYWTFYTYS